MRVLKIVLVALLACVETSASAQTDVRSLTQRLEELGRLWVYFEFFNAYVSAGDVDWDAALIETIPAVRRARTDTQQIAALDAMLRRSGDPSARVLVDESVPAGAQTLPSQMLNGARIANCSTLAAAEDMPAAIAELERAPLGVVLDCRDFQARYAQVLAFQSAIARWRAIETLPGGATMLRSYSGLPPADGATSGAYTAGLSLVGEPPVAAGSGAAGAHPLVIIIDSSVSALLPTFAALQAEGRLRLVSAGDVGSGLVFFDIGSRRAVMSRGIYVYPNGEIGFHPDAIIPPSDEAGTLAVAMAELTGANDASSSPTALRRVSSPTRVYAPSNAAPPAEMRLLALYRLWGAIEYFFPYRDLADRPWDDTLAEFVPVFLAADTREAYETAVLRLAARMQDTHAGASDLRATLNAVAPQAPNFSARYIEGRLVVARLEDATLRDRVSVGDEILAVDGVSLAQIEARLTPLIAHSTPQSLRRRLAWFALAGPPGAEAELRLRGQDGSTRTVRVPRQEWRRPTSDGPVWRMLEGDIGYVDLERLTSGEANRALDELVDAHALILDLRGYPQGTAWIVAPRLARRGGPIVAARYRRPLYIGPPASPLETWASFDQTLPPLEPGRRKFEGPIFVLIDEHAISQSEHMGLVLEAAADVTFVGSPTEGANGDITWFSLPGGLTVRFTGHDVRWPNGRQLQRVGLQPDVAVSPTIAGVRTGRDEVLEAAIALARRGD
ncbi:MAG: S41 family peptidase [Hyphomonadaceae bacterium]